MIWKAYQPNAKAPWNLRRVVHLHRRAGFSAPWEQIQTDLADGHALALDRFLDRKDENDSSMTNTIGDAAVASNNPQRLKAWWLYRMISTNNPLRERLTLMWHNHFATSNRKVNNLSLMRQQNELFRRLGRGRFADLLKGIIKHPAMMIWLDADSNRKGKANENLARETLELFTLGVGNYSESDVKEAARALTGWTVINDRFENRTSRHDEAKLTILGRNQPFTGDQLLELLLDHFDTARRIAWRICKTFLGEGVINEAALEAIAKGLTENDLDIGWAVETVLRSELFFSDSNMRAKVIGPAELIAGAVRSLELDQPPPSTMILSSWAEQMGQDLFYPPNVGGWKEGRSWLGSRTVVARANFANALACGELWHPAKVPDLDQLASRYEIDVSLKERVGWLCELLFGEVIPEAVSQTVSELEKSKPSLASAAAQLISRAEYQLH